jgi:hypothetical protein
VPIFLPAPMSETASLRCRLTDLRCASATHTNDNAGTSPEATLLEVPLEQYDALRDRVLERDELAVSKLRFVERLTSTSLKAAKQSGDDALAT